MLKICPPEIPQILRITLATIFQLNLCHFFHV